MPALMQFHLRGGTRFFGPAFPPYSGDSLYASPDPQAIERPFPLELPNPRRISAGLFAQYKSPLRPNRPMPLKHSYVARYLPVLMGLPAPKPQTPLRCITGSSIFSP